MQDNIRINITKKVNFGFLFIGFAPFLVSRRGCWIVKTFLFIIWEIVNKIKKNVAVPFKKMVVKKKGVFELS